jgi:hypothetical protein
MWPNNSHSCKLLWNFQIVFSTKMVTNIISAKLHCCMQQGPNRSIEHTCTIVHCLVFGKHTKCKYICTQFLVHCPHTHYHNDSVNMWPELPESDIIRNMGGHIFYIQLLTFETGRVCLKLLYICLFCMFTQFRDEMHYLLPDNWC